MQGTTTLSYVAYLCSFAFRVLFLLCIIKTACSCKYDSKPSVSTRSGKFIWQLKTLSV